MIITQCTTLSICRAFGTGRARMTEKDTTKQPSCMRLSHAVRQPDPLGCTTLQAVRLISPPQILDSNPSLYFHLQQQRLIELIRQNKIEEALLFAQAELAPRGEEHPEFLHELEETMTLLAYDVDVAAIEAAQAGTAVAEDGSESGPPPFVAALLHPSHRQATAAEVNAAILTSQSHGPTPKLPNLLRMLAWGEGLLSERADFPTLELQSKSKGTTVANDDNNDVAMIL